MNEDKTYRCGYCGQPTDSKGNVVEYDSDLNYDNAEPTHGVCCAHHVYE